MLDYHNNITRPNQFTENNKSKQYENINNFNMLYNYTRAPNLCLKILG